MSTFFKNFLKSRTIIFNALVIASAGLASVANHDLLAQYPDAVWAVGIAVAAVNVALRVVTATSLFDSPKDDSKKS